MVDPPLPVLMLDEVQGFLLRQRGALDPEIQIRPDEDGYQPFPVRQHLFSAAAQYHEGFSGVSVLAQQLKLHLGHAVLRGAADAPDGAAEQGGVRALIVALQRFGADALVLCGFLQNALVEQGELKPLRQRMGDIQSAAAGFPADGYDQLMGHRKDLLTKWWAAAPARRTAPADAADRAAESDGL